MKPSKQVIKTAHALCKKFKVKLHMQKGLTKKWDIAGHAHCWTGDIYIDTTLDIIEFTTTLFHEIQHCLNYRNKKYYNYHKGNASKKDLRRLGLRAEIYTDIQAKKLAKSFGFTNYQRSYKNNKYYRDMIKARFA